jgi:Na+-driven multidrug efflux pump
MSLPAMGSALFDYLANLLLFALVATVGAAHLAASRIAFNLDMMLFSIAMSLATGCQILVGRSWGAQELPRALHYLRLNRRLMLAVLCVIAVPLVVWPEGVMRLFTSFDDVQKAGANALRLIGLSAPFIAWACSNVSALRALGRTTADMYTNVLPVWVLQLPLGWICGAWLGWGLYGVYIGFIAYWISRAVLAQVLVRRAIHEEIAGVAA